jgi:phosphatidylserine/phosphatidylglycerophosphate/cardiolipin synthase-like enzyme
VSAAYIRAVAQLNWLLEPLEEYLKSSEDRSVIDMESIRYLAIPRQPSTDEILAAIEALGALGILRRCKKRWELDYTRLIETANYRRGIRDAIILLPRPVQSHVIVCAALPLGLSPTVEQSFRSIAVDLRAALLDVIATAQARIVLASPFWDAEVATELATLLVRRAAAGVRIDLLGRFMEKDDAGWAVLDGALFRYEQCRFFAWYEPSESDPFHTQTFHFKAVIADDGLKAYLGSANLTTSGLRSRMELGVILTGQQAIQVAQILDLVLSQTRRRNSVSAAAAISGIGTR